MTDTEKITVVRRFIPANAEVRFTDESILACLNLAETEIINWFYTLQSELPEDAVMPTKYENVQCMAVVVGYGLLGATNESHHHENGTVRIFQYSDMIDYIHAHVFPLARI